jgi:hypothetical protein
MAVILVFQLAIVMHLVAVLIHLYHQMMLIGVVTKVASKITLSYRLPH